eukprot:1065596-Amphidinium_carterae.1
MSALARSLNGTTRSKFNSTQGHCNSLGTLCMACAEASDKEHFKFTSKQWSQPGFAVPKQGIIIQIQQKSKTKQRGNIRTLRDP